MNRKVKLFIATSLDGYIAGVSGNLDFLNSFPNPNNLDHGYAEFAEKVDTVVIGRKTYEDILGFNVPWPYAGMKSFIVTSKKGYEVKTDDTELITDNLQSKIESLIKEDGKDIWLVGGGILVSEMINLNLIDQIQIYIIPIVLGEGLPLFPNKPKETKLELIKSEDYETGLVCMTYKVIKE